MILKSLERFYAEWAKDLASSSSKDSSGVSVDFDDDEFVLQDRTQESIDEFDKLIDGINDIVPPRLPNYAKLTTQKNNQNQEYANFVRLKQKDLAKKLKLH